METYSFLREFADSWMLLFLFLFFIGVVVWVFLPGTANTTGTAPTSRSGTKTNPPAGMTTASPASPIRRRGHERPE
jgi:hypothetical protein